MRTKKCLLSFFIFLIMSAFLLSCGTKQENTKEAKAAEVEQIKERNPVKVVSLAPSITEIIYAVGAGDLLVGRTDYCNYPEEVVNVSSIGSYTSPNVELIVEKSPDLVIASGKISDDVKKQLEDIGIAVYVTTTTNVAEIEEEILNIGSMLGHEKEAEKVVDDMQQKSVKIENIKKLISEKKSAFIDLGNYYTCSTGSFLEGVLEDIYITNIASGAGGAWVQFSAELIVQGNPDVYISFYTPAETLQNSSQLEPLDCLKNGGLIVLDQELGDILQREGPRIVDGELRLMEMIYEKEEN